MDIKVKGDESLFRDSSNGAVINKNKEEFLLHRKRKIDALQAKDKEKEFQQLKNEVKDLKSLISEIYDKLFNNK